MIYLLLLATAVDATGLLHPAFTLFLGRHKAAVLYFVQYNHAIVSHVGATQQSIVSIFQRSKLIIMAAGLPSNEDVGLGRALHEEHQ